VSWDIERHDHVAVVVMNTNRVNAQSREFFADLHEAFDHLDADHTCAAVVLTARGTVFSAGLDLKEVAALLATGDTHVLAAWWETYLSTNLRLFAFPRPIIAAVNGHAIAGGFITAAICDQRIGTTTSDAMYGLNEIDVGIPMPIEYLEMVRNQIGSHAVSYLTLSARLVAHSTATQLGFFHEVVAPDRLLDRAVEVARSVPPESFTAYAQSKRLLRAPALAAINAVAADPGHARAASSAMLDPANHELRSRRARSLESSPD
jgi:enoyl-CoA hydratase